jgi:hypothetical protein
MQCAARMFLQVLWSEGHDVLLCSTRLLCSSSTSTVPPPSSSSSVNRRRRLGAGGAPDPTAAAMRRQLDGASKYGVLAALHLARCPAINASQWKCTSADDDGGGGYDFLMPSEIATQALVGPVAAIPATGQRSSSSSRRPTQVHDAADIASMSKTLVRSVSVFLITFFQEKFMQQTTSARVADSDDAADGALADAEELLSCALRVLPGCFCVEREDMPLVALLFPELTEPQDRSGDSGITRSPPPLQCVCRHEWSRGVMPQLAVSMVFEQCSAQHHDRTVLRRCLAHWSRRWIKRRGRNVVAAWTAAGAPLSAGRDCLPKAALPPHVAAAPMAIEAADSSHSVKVVSDAVVSTDLQDDESEPQPHAFKRHQHDRQTTTPPPQYFDNRTVAAASSKVDVDHRVIAGVPHVPPAAASDPAAPEELRVAFTRWKRTALDPYTRETMRMSQAYHNAQVQALRARRVHLVHQRSSAQKLLRVAFEQWRDVYVPQEVSIRWLTAQRRLRRMQSCWVQWRRRYLIRDSMRREAEAEVKLSLLLEAKAVESTSRVLHHWRSRAVESRFYRVHTATRCVAHWRRCTTLATTFGSAAITAEQVRGRMLSVAVLAQWRRAYREMIANRVYRTKLMKKWAERAVRAKLNRAHSTTAMMLHKATTLRRCLARWVYVWGTVRPINAEADYIISQWRMRRTLKRWNHWRWTVQHDRVAVAAVWQGKDRCALSTLWQRWKLRAALHGAAREFRSRRRLLRLRSCLTTWHERVWLLSALRDQAEINAIELYEWQSRRSVLRRWRERLWKHTAEQHEQRLLDLDHTAYHHRRASILRQVLHVWFGAAAAAVAARGDTITAGSGGALRAPTTTQFRGMMDTFDDSNSARGQLGGGYHARHKDDINESFAAHAASTAVTRPTSHLALARARLQLTSTVMGLRGGDGGVAVATTRYAAHSPFDASHRHWPHLRPLPSAPLMSFKQTAVAAESSDDSGHDVISGVLHDRTPPPQQRRATATATVTRHSSRDNQRQHDDYDDYVTATTPQQERNDIMRLGESDDAIEVVLVEDDGDDDNLAFR